MAKGASRTKSQAISEYLAENKAASPQQVVEALKAKGIDVSLGLAKVVKYGKPGKKKASAKTTRRATVATRKTAVSGSESIRRFIAKYPRAMPKEIQAGLEKQGVTVSAGLISNVKYGAKKKAAKPRRTTRAVAVRAAARKTSGGVSVEQLIEVKRFADSLGGADQVRKALDTLDQLR